MILWLYSEICIYNHLYVLCIVYIQCIAVRYTVMYVHTYKSHIYIVRIFYYVDISFFSGERGTYIRYTNLYDSVEISRNWKKSIFLEKIFFWKVFEIWPRPRSSSWWWRWRWRKRATLRFTISTSHWSTGSLSVLYQKKEERVLRTPRRDSERQRQDSERQRQDAGRMCFCLSNMIELTMFVPWSATLCSRRIGLNWYEKWK